MSINVNKRMCRAFAKVMYFTVVIACKLHSLRLLASSKEKKKKETSPFPAPLDSRANVPRSEYLLRYRMLEITSLDFFLLYTVSPSSHLVCVLLIALASACSPQVYTLPILLSWTSAVENTCFSHLARDIDGEYRLLLPITFHPFIPLRS